MQTKEQKKISSRKYRCGEKGQAYKHKETLLLYGLTPEDYGSMQFQQRGLCAICCQPEQRVRYGQALRLSVDHCHNSGRVRGLLCHACNTSLGGFKDSLALLRDAQQYLLDKG